MAALRTAVSMLGFYDEKAEDMSEEANYRKSYPAYKLKWQQL